ncbi:MAG: response regulator [Armatimonadota bacterium]|nr:response regulator [Armatimonadota bacterium]
MPARLILLIRWMALLVLVVAIALIIARWRLPSASTKKERAERSTLDILKALWTCWRQRRREAREHVLDLAALKRKRVLLVGTEDKYMRAVRWKLEALGCTIDRARTGTQALSRVREQKPDVVIVDALLPDISALDFYELYQDKNTPIAFVGVSTQYRNEFSKLGPRVVCADNEVEPDRLVGQLGRILRLTSGDTHNTRRVHRAAL